MSEPTSPNTKRASAVPGLGAPLDLSLPVGSRVLVVSDLHLGPDPSPAHVMAIAELVQTIEAWTGPGVMLFNGNTFESAPAAGGAGLPTKTEAAAVAPALGAHPRLEAAVVAFASGPGRRVVVLPGDRDAALAWSEPERKIVATRLGAEVALAVDLEIATGAGARRVRVEGGQQLDPLAACQDPTNRGESPVAYHLRTEFLPAVRRSEASGKRRDAWLAGMDLLDDPATFPRFLASRLTYRKLAGRAWLVVIPVLVAVALRLPTIAIAHAAGIAHSGSDRLLVLATATVVELVVLAGIAVAAVRRTWKALAGLSLGEGQREPNRNARDRARDLIGTGHTGLITGHTCRPELTHLGAGFFANAGCGAEVVTEVSARFPGLGLPPVFQGQRQLSWVELEAGNELHVRLFHARQDSPGATIIERLVARRVPDVVASRDIGPQLVATFPQGSSWPTQPSGQLRRRRIRRLAGIFVGLAGFVSLLSSLSDPIKDRLVEIRHIVPIVVPETASALTAIGGVALLVLARGVRRGQRRSWAVTIAILLVTVVLHLIKGVDVEEAVVALAIAAFLWLNRAEFKAATETPRLRGGLARWAVAVVAVVVAGTAGIKLSLTVRNLAGRALDSDRRRFTISWGRALLATVERMVGVDHVYLPRSINRFFTPAVTAAAIGLAITLLVLIFRPVVARRRRSEHSGESDLARARAILARHGSGTLDYFALRPDKEFFFWGDTVAAYAVYGGVCLVSPDPIGPVPEREPAWRAFRRFVDEHGWALGGLGAGEDWLPVYRATGMHDLYAGDEGVVRVKRFTLEGGRFKSLRQAVNRVAKHGYRISFHDPSSLDPGLRAGLEAVMTKSRRGDVERGFSMTLGRVFEPDDAGLLLAVVHGPAGADDTTGADGTTGGVGGRAGAGGGGGAGDALGPPVAFCQYVPAPGIAGYSLDLMRRDDGEHPNGLIDFAVVETVRYLRDRGADGLGLNFATMRAVLAGETGEGPAQRIQAWLLRRMGDSMQIESLWKFNAKFDPDWQPRYALYDAPENAFAVAVAIARAESFWELPVIGRFLVPSVGRGAEDGDEPGEHTGAECGGDAGGEGEGDADLEATPSGGAGRRPGHEAVT